MQSAERTEADRNGRRVLAIWLVWLALAMFLGAVGVVCW